MGEAVPRGRSATPAARTTALIAALTGGALTLIAANPAWAGAVEDDDLASRFVTAPETAPDQQQLVGVEVNGVDLGSQLIRVSNGSITLPPATVTALGIIGSPGQSLNLTPESKIGVRFNEAQASLSLTVPVAMLASQRFAPGGNGTKVRLSPETWGAYVNYDVNLRHGFGPQSQQSFGPATGGLGGAWGGVADLRVLAPDVIGDFGWAYDSANVAADAVARLDSTLTWRPAWLDVAVSAGDAVSVTTDSLASARSYRFGGLQIGTDYSGTPGWSGSPIASVSGSAQAQSALDVYLDGQRTYHADTPGGPFSLVLPPGSTGAGTSVVVTDVTGRSVIVPVEVPRTDVQLLRQGLFLWSAGVGSPRFGYGTAQSTYDGNPYAYANARYGASNRVTATVHAEGGTGLAEVEGGADMALTPWLAAHVSVAASQSGEGAGGAGHLGMAIAGPWNLGLEATVAHTIGSFNDVVSVSGRDYARRYDLNPIFSLPATSEVSARLSWQPGPRFSISASYQANTYQGTSSIGFASLSANYLLADRIPLFANLSRVMGGQQTKALVVGVSFSLGGVQGSVSGGYGSGSGANGPGNRSGYTGSYAASKPMGESVGDVGWGGFATQAPTGNFANADAEVRTGYGIPGVAVQSFGNQVTSYATLRGSAGVVGMHPFVADPASGGLIIADAGSSGVPVQLNGYDRGRTWFDGQLAIPGAVPGVPQRLALDTARLPIDAVPGETDQLAVVRDGGATVTSFGVRSASAAASLRITVAGGPPPVGSTLVAAGASMPISKEGRAYVPVLERDEVLTVELPDGSKCRVQTHFDGHGGVGRRLGTFACEEVP